MLGDTVQQRGSLVSPDKLRFDFDCAKSLTSAQLKQLDDEINDVIQ
jgi:alanyl-tRNA synthetase